MMKLTLSSWTAAAALTAGLLASPAAFAQGTWDLGGSSCNPSSTASNNSAVCSVGTVQATMTSWGNTGAGGAFVQQQLGENDPSGFGSIFTGNETGTNSHHAFDNKTTNCGANGTTGTGCGGTQEFMLISFNTKVNLSGMSIGYFDTDADVSIYRWDGNSAANGATGAGAGWVLVSSEDLSGANGPTFGVNDATATRNGATSTNLYSSWWMISTYIGGAGANGLDATNNDAFKIKGFTAGVCTGTITGGSSGGTSNNNGGSCSTTGTPEPGSLALAGLALVGVVAARRRPAAALQAA